MGVKSAPKEAPIPVLQVQKLSEKGRTPTRASALAAGYDVYSAREAVIPARGWGMVDTDVAVGVPAGTCKFGFGPCCLGRSRRFVSC